MTGTVVTHRTQVGQSGTAANNFTIRTLDDGSLRISRGNAGAEISDILVIDANGNFSTAPVLGVGQTWQNLTGSRAAGTTYTNTTGRPIFVVPTMQHDGGVYFNATFTINGVMVSAMNSGNATYSVSCPYGFVVPAGGTYSLDITAGGGTLSYWSELR